MANVLSNPHPPVGAVEEQDPQGSRRRLWPRQDRGQGQKGQKARHAGNFSKMAFQGGQTPIQRRLPKRGFRNPSPRTRCRSTCRRWRRSSSRRHGGLRGPVKSSGRQGRHPREGPRRRRPHPQAHAQGPRDLGRRQGKVEQRARSNWSEAPRRRERSSAPRVLEVDVTVICHGPLPTRRPPVLRAAPPPRNHRWLPARSPTSPGIPELRRRMLFPGHARGLPRGVVTSPGRPQGHAGVRGAGQQQLLLNFFQPDVGRRARAGVDLRPRRDAVRPRPPSSSSPHVGVQAASRSPQGGEMGQRKINQYTRHATIAPRRRA